MVIKNGSTSSGQPKTKNQNIMVYPNTAFSLFINLLLQTNAKFFLEIG
jgi:hypothetical protein